MMCLIVSNHIGFCVLLELKSEVIKHLHRDRIHESGMSNFWSASAIAWNVKVARPKIIAAGAVKRSRSSAFISFSRTENVKAPRSRSHMSDEFLVRDDEMIPFIFTLARRYA